MASNNQHACERVCRAGNSGEAAMQITESRSSAMVRRASALAARCQHARRLILAPAVLMSAAALLPPAATQAAEATSGEAAPSTTLEEVIVTAERREERLLDVPVSTS